MKSIKNLTTMLLLASAFKMHCQAPAIHTEYIAPEVEQKEDPKKPYIIGGTTFALILVGIALRKRLKKKRNANL